MKPKKYHLNKYPKFRYDDKDKLSGYQIDIRDNQKFYTYTDEKICPHCHLKLSINEFHFQNRKTGQRKYVCRDCMMKKAGIKEIGKIRFGKDIAKKGFKKCTICKDIKPISEFGNKSDTGSRKDFVCLSCKKDLDKLFYDKRKDNLSDTYIIRLLKRHKKEISNEIIEETRKRILEKRAKTYELDGLIFSTIKQIANYIEKKYGIKASVVIGRLGKGKTVEECLKKTTTLITETRSKGKIKTTNLRNNEINIYSNTFDENLLKLFSKQSITNALKKNLLIKQRRYFKNKDLFKIERIIKNPKILTE